LRICAGIFKQPLICDKPSIMRCFCRHQRKKVRRIDCHIAQTRSFPTEIPPLYEFKDAFGIESTQLVTRVLHLDLRPLFVGNESRFFFGKFLNLAPGSGNLSFGTLDGRPSLSDLADQLISFSSEFLNSPTRARDLAFRGFNRGFGLG
jgi:hypothetical protein